MAKLVLKDAEIRRMEKYGYENKSPKEIYDILLNMSKKNFGTAEVAKDMLKSYFDVKKYMSQKKEESYESIKNVVEQNPIFRLVYSTEVKEQVAKQIDIDALRESVENLKMVPRKGAIKQKENQVDKNLTDRKYSWLRTAVKKEVDKAFNTFKAQGFECENYFDVKDEKSGYSFASLYIREHVLTKEVYAMAFVKMPKGVQFNMYIPLDVDMKSKTCSTLFDGMYTSVSHLGKYRVKAQIENVPGVTYDGTSYSYFNERPNGSDEFLLWEGEMLHIEEARTIKRIHSTITIVDGKPVVLSPIAGLFYKCSKEFFTRTMSSANNEYDLKPVSLGSITHWNNMPEELRLANSDYAGFFGFKFNKKESRIEVLEGDDRNKLVNVPGIEKYFSDVFYKKNNEAFESLKLNGYFDEDTLEFILIEPEFKSDFIQRTDKCTEVTYLSDEVMELVDKRKAFAKSPTYVPFEVEETEETSDEEMSDELAESIRVLKSMDLGDELESAIRALKSMF